MMTIKKKYKSLVNTIFFIVADNKKSKKFTEGKKEVNKKKRKNKKEKDIINYKKQKENIQMTGNQNNDVLENLGSDPNNENNSDSNKSLQHNSDSLNKDVNAIHNGKKQ